MRRTHNCPKHGQEMCLGGFLKPDHQYQHWCIEELAEITCTTWREGKGRKE